MAASTHATGYIVRARWHEEMKLALEIRHLVERSLRNWPLALFASVGVLAMLSAVIALLWD